MSRVVAALGSALLLGACAIPGTSEARAFSTGFRAGDSLRFRDHITVAGSLLLGSQQVPVRSDQRLTETITVQSVDRSGAATLLVTSEDIISGLSGASTSLKPPPATLRIGPDGAILAGTTATPGGTTPSVPGSDQLTPLLPRHPVRPGDTWDRQYSRPNPFGEGTFTLSAHSRYVRDEAVGGAQAAVIDATVQGPIDFVIDFARLKPPAAGSPPGLGAGPVHYIGRINTSTRYWIDISSQHLVKSSATGTYNLAYALAVSSGQGSGPQQVTFNGTIRTDLAKL